MATVSFDDMLPYVLPFVAGCPTIVIKTHLAEAAARFCAESKVWRVDVEEDTTLPGEPDYELDLPSNTKLEDVLWLKLDGTDLDRVTDRLEPPSDDRAQPDRFAIYGDNQIRFYETPGAVYAFRAVAVIKPSLKAKGIEEFLYETFGRVISYGALAQLMAIPKKEWSDLASAGAYENMFLDGITMAKSRDSRKVKRRTKAYY